MRYQYYNDGNGNAILHDTSDNCLISVENWIYKHHCSKCGTYKDDMHFISEVGYYDRDVTLKCKCGAIVKYQG